MRFSLRNRSVFWHRLCHAANPLPFNSQLPLIPGRTLYPLAFPQDAERGTWFEDAFEFVNINLGRSYANLVARWIELERINKWRTKVTGLAGKSQRPSELTAWIVSGRYGQRSKPIVIAPENVAEFGATVWIWWTSLQPQWREMGPTQRHLPVDKFGDQWKSLDHCGANGWLSFLACLRWWGECLVRMEKDTPRTEGVQDWLLAIHDMTKMIEGLILYKEKK